MKLIATYARPVRPSEKLVVRWSFKGFIALERLLCCFAVLRSADWSSKSWWEFWRSKKQIVFPTKALKSSMMGWRFNLLFLRFLWSKTALKILFKTTSWSTEHSLSSYFLSKKTTSFFQWWRRWRINFQGTSVQSTMSKSSRLLSIKLLELSMVCMHSLQALDAELISSSLKMLSCWLSWMAIWRWIGKKSTKWQAEATVRKELQQLTS